MKHTLEAEGESKTALNPSLHLLYPIEKQQDEPFFACRLQSSVVVTSSSVKGRSHLSLITGFGAGARHSPHHNCRLGPWQLATLATVRARGFERSRFRSELPRPSAGYEPALLGLPALAALHRHDLLVLPASFGA